MFPLNPCGRAWEQLVCQSHWYESMQLLCCSCGLGRIALDIQRASEQTSLLLLQYFAIDAADIRLFEMESHMDYFHCKREEGLSFMGNRRTVFELEKGVDSMRRMR
jgi:hypothetical protein